MRTLAISSRVLSQIRHDRRFLALSLIVPVLVIYMLWIFFDSVENPIFEPDEFIVPVGAFLVHFLTYFLCAIVLVRERSAQTLARMFVNGYRRSQIVSGYLLAYTTLATVQTLIVMIELQLLFELGYDVGELLFLYLVIWLLAIISISLGIFVSNFARNEGQVFPFIPLVVVPGVFLSGLIVPVSQLPDWISWLSVFTPLFYANEAILSISGDGDAAFVLALVVYGLLVLTLGIFTLRERE